MWSRGYRDHCRSLASFGRADRPSASVCNFASDDRSGRAATRRAARPLAPMKQNAYCTEVGVLPGTDFQLQPKYMEMLNLNEAWQFGRGDGVKVAVIDTGVTPHPRLPRLIPGGDYVMAGGDGLSDCDAHGTLVASMIAAVPANGAVPLPSVPRRPVTIPTTETPPPPQTVTLSPVPPQTVTVIPAPPPEEGVPPGAPVPGPEPPPAPGPQPPAVDRGGGTVTVPSYSGGRKIAPIDNPRNPHPSAPSPALGPPPDAFSGIAPVSR